MKPESWPVAEEAHWKTWKFKEIITEAMEHENLRIRKELANFEEKYSHQERLHKAVISELETERAHKADLHKALENAYSFIKIRDKEIGNLEKSFRALVRQRDRLKNHLKLRDSSAPSLKDTQSSTLLKSYSDSCAVISVSGPSMSVVKAAIAFEGEESKELVPSRSIGHVFIN